MALTGYDTSYYETRNVDDARQGWTASPNARGTIDIIWSSCLTLFLCCWCVLVVNVPKESRDTYLLRSKLFLVCLCAMAPELIFQVAMGQWLAARYSLANYRKSKVEEFRKWTIKHVFYANMGGFHLKTEDFVSFPLNADQLLYLVEKGYLVAPEVSASHIRDKNKLDGMLRFLTLVQTFWYLANVMARAAQNLAITALELSTVAFVMLGVATSLCWMSKPADVKTPDELRTNIPMAQILTDAGDAADKVYYYTPLDFVSRREWGWSRLWSHGLNLLRRVRIAAPPSRRPIRRIQNTVIPPVEGKHYLLFVVVSMAYFAIFIAGWNFSFPTRTEQILWRVASITALASALIVCIMLQITESWLPLLAGKFRQLQTERPRRQNTATQRLSQAKSPIKRNRFTRFIWRLENNSLMRDPELYTPIGLIIVTWCCGIPYSLSRIYVVVADFVELRSLPASAYQAVDWQAFWPHF